MPPARPWLPADLFREVDDLNFRDELENGLSSIRFTSALPRAIEGLRQTRRAIEEMPIVVSERPDQARIAEQQGYTRGGVHAGGAGFSAAASAGASQPSALADSAIPGPDLSPDSGTPVRSPGEMAPEIAAATGQTAAPDTSTWRGGDSPNPATPSGDHGQIDNSSRQAFVRSAFPYMLEAAGGDRNLAELMLAKAINENGDVGGGGGFIGNNFSGIKGEGSAGSFEADTWEDYGQGRVNIRDRFAAFRTPQEGFRAFMGFLYDNPRYGPALQRYQQTGDASQLFRDIHAAGYATDPVWADKIENIRRNQVAPVVRGVAQAAGPGPAEPLSSPPAGGSPLDDVMARTMPTAPPASPTPRPMPEQASQQARLSEPMAEGDTALDAARAQSWSSPGALDRQFSDLRELPKAPLGTTAQQAPERDDWRTEVPGSAPSSAPEVPGEYPESGYDPRDADAGPREIVPAYDPRTVDEGPREAIPYGPGLEGGRPVEPAPEVSRQEMPSMPGLQPVLDAAGNVIAWVQAQLPAAPPAQPNQVTRYVPSYAPQAAQATAPVYDPRDADSGPREARPSPPLGPVPSYAPQASQVTAEQAPSRTPVDTVIRPALETLDAANEWIINNPIVGQFNPQAWGRELAGTDQLHAEVGADIERLRELIRRYQAGDTSVEAEMRALNDSINARVAPAGRSNREVLLEAGERNPNKTAETLGQVVQAGATLAMAPSLASGPVRNAAAAALDPLGQAIGAVPDVIGVAARTAGAGARALGEEAGRQLLDLTPAPRMIQETGGGVPAPRRPWELTRAEYEQGTLLHGTRAPEFEQFEPGNALASYFTNPADLRPGQKPYAENFARDGGRVIRVKTEEGRTKMFDPTRDPQAMEIYERVIADENRWPRGTHSKPWSIEYFDALPMIQEARKYGYNHFRFWEPAAGQFSEAISDPSIIRQIPEHRAMVAEALARGERVPPEVLADYPDLKPPDAPPSPAVPVPAGPRTPPRGPQTVETLREQLDNAVARIADARRTGDDVAINAARNEAARIESDLADALNARRRAEPMIRSEVGTRLEEAPVSQTSAEDAMRARFPDERVRVNPDDLSGPVSIPASTAGRRNAAVPFDPASAAAGSGAGLTNEDEEFDPLRAGAGALAAGIVGRRARGAIPRPYQTARSAGEMVSRIREVEMVTPRAMLDLIGDRPDYLKDVASFMLEQRGKVSQGRMTPRDVAKAYYMTVASQGSDAVSRRIIESKVPGFKIPDDFLADPTGARDLVRPEEAAAAWLFSPNGKRALDAIERGEFIPELWAEGAAVRRAFGDDRFRTTNVFSERAPINPRRQFNMTNLTDFTAQFNAAAQAGDLEAIDRLSQRLNGVGAGKLGFVKHALGFGETPTIDAVEINAWLTGRGETGRLQTPEAEMVRDIRTWLKDRSVGEALRERITRAFGEMNATMAPDQKAGLPDEIFNHVLHHWIWDRMKGTATTHKGFYDAMRRASMLPFDPASAAAGSSAGLTGEGEDGDAEFDPLRAGAGALAAGVLGRRMSPAQRKALQDAYRKAAQMAAERGTQAVRAAEGNVPPSRLREPLLPGMEPPTTARPIGEVAEGLALTPEQRTARIDRSLEQFPAARNWYERARMRNERAIATRNPKNPEPVSALRYVADLIGNIGYSSMLGPVTASVNVFTGLAEPLWNMGKEFTRQGVRAVRTGNAMALREQGKMHAGAFYGMTQLGESILDLFKGQGRYASNPNFPTLSERTADPIARLVAQATEFPGRIWTGLPDAIFGTIALHAGQAREAAQIATNKGLRGQDWHDEVAQLLSDSRAVLKGEMAPSTDVQQIVEAGNTYADRQTYRGELGQIGKVGQKVARLGNLPVLGPWASPFYTSIWHAGLRQAEKSPIGAVMNTQSKSWRGLSHDKVYDTIVGTAVLTAIGAYATRGGVTGSGPSDPKERELLQAKGWQRYSTLVPMPNGEAYYLPNRLFAPMESALNAAGELHDASAYQKKDATEREKLDQGIARIGQLIRQNPYALSGIVQLLETAQYGVASTIAEQATRMTPFAATTRAISTAGDPVERTTDRGKDVDIADEIVQRWQQSVGMRRGLPDAQDAFGQPKPNEQPGAWAFAPRIRRAGPAPVADVFREGKVMPGQPKTEIGLNDDPDLPKVKLSPRERRYWDQQRGALLLQAGQIIAENPNWRDLPAEGKEKVLTDIMTQAGKMADEQTKAFIGGDEMVRRIRVELDKRKAS